MRIDIDTLRTDAIAHGPQVVIYHLRELPDVA